MGDWVTEKRIVDAEAKKPDDWDDEEDGEWEPPMKDNPAFKGEWTVKRISNPAYKGIWEAKKIDNPEYEDDNAVYKYTDFGFIGFDLWQVKGARSLTTSSFVMTKLKPMPSQLSGKRSATWRKRGRRKRKRKRRRKTMPN